MGKKLRKPGKKSKGGGSKAPSSPRVQLLDDDGEMTKPFKLALVELFARFDEDGDKLLSEAELKAFSRAANEDEREFSAEELQEVRDFFDWKDVAGGGGLTLRGWIQLYHTQTQSREEDTWSDLHRLGYTGQLKPRPKPTLKAQGELLAKLQELLELGGKGDLEGFVAAFVADDVEEDDRLHFLETLRGGGDGSNEEEEGQLGGLLAELRCCATGEGVFKVEGDPEEGPVVFHFRSPAPGMERIDREVVFVREDDGRWCAEG